VRGRSLLKKFFSSSSFVKRFEVEVELKKLTQELNSKRAQETHSFSLSLDSHPNNIKTGVWFAAAASSEVLLRGAALAAEAAEEAEEDNSSSPPSPSSSSSTSGEGQGAGGEQQRRKPPPMLRSGGDAMWHAVLELMGGEHAEMSRALRSAAQRQQRPPSSGGGGGGGEL